ncbi:MAG: tyrosine-type recombinase/integrase, partial [Actinomycetota bacterium]|nr:tyrosine-type recombinase/integrase [Actinomycetota bacterium]
EGHRVRLGVYRQVHAEELTAGQLQVFLARRWAAASPATWNRQVATLRSFTAWCTRQGWVDHDPTSALERRSQPPPDNARSIPYRQLERLWHRTDVPVREKTLWRLAYETAARANELLALDVEDLDLPNKRARIVSQGGAHDLIHYQTGAAQLLPRLLNGRRRGPVFLTDRRPVRAIATATCALKPGGHDCPTAAPPNCSSGCREAGPCTSCATRPSPTSPKTTPRYRC